MAFTLNLWVVYIGCYIFVYLLRMWAEKTRGEPFEDPELASQKKVMISALIWMISGLALSIFVPLSRGLPLFIGIGLAILGLVIVGFSFYSFAQNRGLNTSKIHKYTRNPNYIGWDIFMGSLILLGWSTPLWNTLLICYFLYTVLYLHYAVLQEEKFLTNKYGAPYREYLKSTPRYFGKPRQ